jgi:hypothetical protein
MGVMLGDRRFKGPPDGKRALHRGSHDRADLRNRLLDLGYDGTLEAVSDEPSEKIPEEIQLELLAPWYSENKRDSRTLDLFDAIPKYPFSVTTTRDVPPRMVVGIRVSLRAVLDLTNLKSVLTPLDLGHLLLEDWRQNKWRAKGKPLSGVRARCD